METALGPLLTALIKLGAPWIIVAVFVVLFWFERKKSSQLADKLFELGMSMAKSNTEVNSTLRNVERDVDDLSRRFKT